MNPLTNTAKALTGLMLLWLAGTVNAAWTLNNDASRLSFISIKKDTVAEVHKFSHLSGSVDDQGNAEVTIQLASVDTAVPIRDERMRDILFQTNLFPTASVTAKVDPAEFTGLVAGQFRNTETQITVSLHGQTKQYKAAVSVIKLRGGSLMVSSIYPIIVNAGDFELTKGVEELRKLAGLPAISTAVPVSLVLVFDVAD
jgi:polyisoprenoid-binding protein YceI